MNSKSASNPVYCLFGLRIRSNLVIPGFAPVSQSEPVDVSLSLGDFPDQVDRAIPPVHEAFFVSPDIGESGEPTSRVWRVNDDQYFRVLYADGTDCVVDRMGRRIWISWPECYTILDVVPYLQGQLLGLVQRLRGVICLHASSILIGENAVAVTGPAGAGKSSTAAAFLRLGYTVLADDVTSIFEEQGRFMVRPAHPRIWLCPDMVEALFGSNDALPLLAPSWDKRYLDLNRVGPGLPLESKPLAAIYLLSERASDPDRPRVTKGAPRDILLKLVSNTYVNHLLDSEMRSKEFQTLSRIQRSVPVRIVHPHEDASRISQLCDAICADVAQYSMARAGTFSPATRGDEI